MDEIGSFGEWVQLRRETLRLTRRQLADIVVCSPVTIKKIERDERRPSRQIAKLLAEHLQIPTSNRTAFLRWARGEFVTSLPAPDNLDNRLPEAEPNHTAKVVNQIPNNLPIQSMPFIGREAEMTAVQTLLADATIRLITIVGPGGMGKTRLGLAVAERQLASSGPAIGATPTDGIFFIDLAPLNESDRIVPAVAEALKFPLQGQADYPPQQQLLDYLHHKKMLLLFDNFEHLLDGVDWLAEILQTAPNIQLLATSRERLHLQAEHIFPIEGLEFPDWETPEDAAEYTAVQLFFQSARRNQPDFDLENQDDLTYLARICRTVAGMPLALQLAASWVDMMTLSEIAAELQQGLDFLETDLRDIPERHRSIRTAIDHSWQNLDDKERDVFAKLSIFRGGFSRESAQVVAGTNLKQLARLVNKSLLQGGGKRDGRYQIHELLRQYGAEKLSAQPELEPVTRQKHCEHFCQTLVRWEQELKGELQLDALAEMDADLENCFVAWQWAVNQNNFTVLLKMIYPLGHYFDWQGRLGEGISLFEKALELFDKDKDYENEALDFYLIALSWQTYFAQYNGNIRIIDRNKPHINKMLELRTIHGDRIDAFVAFVQGQLTEDRELREHYLRQSKTIYDQLHLDWDRAFVSITLADVVRQVGRIQEAKALFKACIHTLDQLGDKRALDDASLYYHFLLNQTGQYEEALESAYRQVAYSEQIGNRLKLAHAYSDVGSNLQWFGEFEKAREFMAQALNIYAEFGRRPNVAIEQVNLGRSEMHLGNFQIGYELIVKGVEHFRKTKRTLSLCGPLVSLGLCSMALEKYDESIGQFKEVNQLQESIYAKDTLGISLALLGTSYVKLGQLDLARQTFYKALTLGLAVDQALTLELSLLGIALYWGFEHQTSHLSHQHSQLHQQAELYYFLWSSPLFNRSAAVQKIWQEPIRTSLTFLSTEELEIAQEKGQQLNLQDTAEAMLAEITKLGWGQVKKNSLTG